MTDAALLPPDPTITAGWWVQCGVSDPILATWDADVALSAMEEPTEAMVDAGTRAYDEGEGEYGIFCAMIRKAKEG